MATRWSCTSGNNPTWWRRQDRWNCQRARSRSKPWRECSGSCCQPAADARSMSWERSSTSCPRRVQPTGSDSRLWRPVAATTSGLKSVVTAGCTSMFRSSFLPGQVLNRFGHPINRTAGCRCRAIVEVEVPLDLADSFDLPDGQPEAVAVPAVVAPGGRAVAAAPSPTLVAPIAPPTTSVARSLEGPAFVGRWTGPPSPASSVLPPVGPLGRNRCSFCTTRHD